MNPKQNTLYWREWGALTRACKAAGQAVPDRHDLHVRALGSDKSHKSFTNAEFDKVLGVFRSYSQPAAVDQQLRQLGQPRARKLHKVGELLKCLALYVEDAPAYAREIIRDKVDKGSWRNVTAIEDLSEQAPHPDRPSQLEQLIMTLERALNGKTGLRAKAGHSLHDMRTAAGLKCTCLICIRRQPRAVLVPAGAEVEQPF
jgi:hypothetical protein